MNPLEIRSDIRKLEAMVPSGIPSDHIPQPSPIEAGEKSIYMQKVPYSMKYADRCVRRGDAFSFQDSTGLTHGEFEIGNFVSPAPSKTLGAIKISTKLKSEWFWIIEK